MEIELFNRKKLQQPLYKYHYRINDSVDCDRFYSAMNQQSSELEGNGLLPCPGHQCSNVFWCESFIYLIPYNKTKI